MDALSVAIGRPVLLDDPSLAPVAYSRQWGDIDGVRRASIMARGAPEPVRDALMAQGIAEASDVVRTTAEPALGMTERVCVPVRSGGSLLGYIWLLDPAGTLSDDDLNRARAAARRVATLLSAPADRSVADEGALIQRLVAQSPASREAAAAELRTRGALRDAPLVLSVLVSTSDNVEPLTVALLAVHRLSVNHAIGGRFFEGAAVLASPHDPVLRTLGPDEIAEWLHATSPAGLAVGQSGPAGLSDLADAARHARIALRAARTRTHARSFAAWPTLGADRLVAQLPDSWREDLPQPLVRLLDEQPALTATLAAFLEAGGDVKATAEAMSLHRSGVYYRLRRIEELTGLRLRSGEDRLLAHLAIRAEHLF